MRPKFHLTAPKGLINDPNGFIKYHGEYYLFFQWNPTGLKHENKHWGLQKTKDFIHFSKTEIALAPDQTYDKGGCYSGSSRVEEDKLYLFYTGNVKNNKKRESTQCLAYQTQDEYKKIGPIIDTIPKGYTGHFRDPYYFENKGQDYFIIGAQSEDLKGHALIYNWDVLQKPYLLGPLRTNFDFNAYMWECPNLFHLDGQDIMIFSPQGITNEKTRYQNLYHALYSVGKLDIDQLDYKVDYYEELDYGFDFYAPQVLAQENLLIAWMGLPEDESIHLSKNENWMHCLTMVRELSLKDGKLIQKPHSNYQKLRQTAKDLKVEDKLISKSGEIHIKMKLNQDSEFNFALFASDNYQTVLSFKNNLLTLNRESSEGLKGKRYLELSARDTLDLQIFMDESTLEIFINEGEKVLSARVYNTDVDAGFHFIDLKSCELEMYRYYDYEVQDEKDI